jgi:hypothetical protein
MNEYVNEVVPTGPQHDHTAHPPGQEPAERRGKKDADRKDGKGTGT